MITNRVGAMTLRTSGQPIPWAGAPEKGATMTSPTTPSTSSTRSAPKKCTKSRRRFIASRTC